jgi:hypothetical protein
LLEAVLTSQSLWDTEPQEEQKAPQALQEPEELIEPEELLEPEEAEFFEAPPEDEAEEFLDPDVHFEPLPSQPVEAHVLAPVLVPAIVKEPATEKEPEAVQTPESEQDVVALSSDEFTALEERILRAVNLVKRERLARTEAEERATVAEAGVMALTTQLAEKTPQVDRLQAEVHALQTERDQVRQRVERLLTQLDALEL